MSCHVHESDCCQGTMIRVNVFHLAGERPDLSLATSTKSTAKQAVCTPHTVDETSAYYAAIQFESSRTPRQRAPLRSKNGSFTTWWDEHEDFIVLTSNCLYWNLRPLKTETGNQAYTRCLKCLPDDRCTNVVLQLTGPEFNSKLNVIFQRLKGQYV